jgi:hypothetical protein
VKANGGRPCSEKISRLSMKRSQYEREIVDLWLLTPCIASLNVPSRMISKIPDKILKLVVRIDAMAKI